MFPQASMQPINQLSIVPLLPLGTIFFSPKDQGRTAYKYVAFGGTSTITAGLLLVAPAAPSNSTALVIPTAQPAGVGQGLSSGSTLLTVTNGATAVTANQFQDGTLEVIGTNGNSRYRIAGNSADSVGSAALTIELADPLRNTSALVAGTNTVNLRQNAAYLPTASLTKADAVGVTIMPVANTASVTNYGWVQVAGDCFVFATSATKGFPLVQDTSGTAGYLANSAANTAQIGICREAVGSSLATVNLQLI